MGTLLALHPGGWSGAELVALQALAEAAVAELRCLRETEARRWAEARLRLLERALHAVDLGVTITDEDGRIVFTNPAEAQMHGYTAEELVGRAARSLAPPELWSPEARVPARPVRRWMRERVNVRRDGTRFPVRLWSDMVASDDDDERPLGLVTWSEDLSGRAPSAVLRSDAERDPLTGLLNRAAFLRALGQACDARGEKPGGGFAVLFMDLDRFKTVNDRLGHAAGDAFLGVVGERLEASVRPTDLVARIGGDEFAALLHGVEREQDALSVVERIQRQLGEPVVIGDAEMRASASIGVALGHQRQHAGGHPGRGGPRHVPRQDAGRGAPRLQRARRAGARGGRAAGGAGPAPRHRPGRAYAALSAHRLPGGRAAAGAGGAGAVEPPRARAAGPAGVSPRGGGDGDHRGAGPLGAGRGRAAAPGVGGRCRAAGRARERELLRPPRGASPRGAGRAAHAARVRRGSRGG